MKKTISMTLAALLALPVLAGPPGKGHAQRAMGRLRRGTIRQ